MVLLENINIDMDFLENFDIDIDFLENILTPHTHLSTRDDDDDDDDPHQHPQKPSSPA